jgi:hemolysin III
VADGYVAQAGHRSVLL